VNKPLYTLSDLDSLSESTSPPPPPSLPDAKSSFSQGMDQSIQGIDLVAKDFSDPAAAAEVAKLSYEMSHRKLPESTIRGYEAINTAAQNLNNAKGLWDNISKAGSLLGEVLTIPSASVDMTEYSFGLMVPSLLAEVTGVAASIPSGIAAPAVRATSRVAGAAIETNIGAVESLPEVIAKFRKELGVPDTVEATAKLIQEHGDEIKKSIFAGGVAMTATDRAMNLIPFVSQAHVLLRSLKTSLKTVHRLTKEGKHLPKSMLEKIQQNFLDLKS